MEKPFTVLKAGKSELVLGQHPDGRPWLHAVCVLCGGNCPRVFGRLKRGPASTIRSLLPKVTGYHLLEYRSTYITKATNRGWSWKNIRTTIVRDTCPACSTQICKKILVDTRVYTQGGGYSCARMADLTLDDCQFYFRKYLKKYHPDKLAFFQDVL